MNVKTDDDSLRCRGKENVRLRNPPGRLVDDVDFHLIGAQIDQGFRDSLHGALHIAFDDDVQLLDFAFLNLLVERVKTHMAFRAEFRRSVFVLSCLADGSGILF